MMWLRRAMGYEDPQPQRVSPIEDNPVGWSSIYPPQVMTNPDPNVSPVVDPATMTTQAKLGRALMGKSREPATAADLPAAEQKANTMVDLGMAVAGATQPLDIKAVGQFADAVIQKFPGVKLSLQPARDGGLTLSQLVVPKEMRSQGIGTQVMQEILKYADANGARIGLTPSDAWGGNVRKLEEFYKRFGFKPNTGRSRDFTTWETMLRDAP
jgi:GNAT superfamily N-acetyltransferase